MDLFEQVIGSVLDGSRQIDPVCHVANLLESIDKGSVRATHLLQDQRQIVRTHDV